MKLSVYNDIVKYLNSRNDDYSLDDIYTKFSEFSQKTLASIYSQEYQKKMKRIHSKHHVSEKMDEYYYRYCEESQHRTHQHVILHLARMTGLSPSLMARIILERHLMYTKYNGQAVPKSVVTQMLKDTSQIEDPLLALEIDMCSTADCVYGPIADTIKLSLGHEKEDFLKRKLDELGLPYQGEDQLRAKGYDKTPDTILQVPIAVDGCVVNWIESKALFGDPANHAAYLKDQFWSYWNRFGAGLVIYWFDFVEELDVHREKGILLMDRFPEDFVTITTFI